VSEAGDWRGGGGLKDRERQKFDELVEEAIESLPDHIRALLDEVPLVVEDRPSEKLMRELREEGLIEPEVTDEELAEDLCGLHTGIALTERSVEEGALLPDEIMLFREGIISMAGGWDSDEGEDAIYDEIVVTLLHEIGHHFGLDEGDLEALGYD